jgi:hypothetical protein
MSNLVADRVFSSWHKFNIAILTILASLKRMPSIVFLFCRVLEDFLESTGQKENMSANLEKESFSTYNKGSESGNVEIL